MRCLAAGLLVCLPLYCQDGVVVKDIFGRVLNQIGLTLVDWDGYMANPAIRFTVIPPANARFPATAVLTANEQRLYFDLPSTAGANGPRKTISFADAASHVDVYLGNAPDRDSTDGFSHVDIRFVDADGHTSVLTIPVHEIDQDRESTDRYQISIDFSRDATGFFATPANRAPIQQALADWSYFFGDRKLDTVAPGRETTLIWNSDGFVSNRIVTNQKAYTGSLLYVYGIHSPALRSGGEPSSTGRFQTSRGASLPLRRSGGVEVETAGNFNSLGWLTSVADASWWVADQLASGQNELFSIVHHESGHALAFNPAQSEFGKFKTKGCINDPAIMAYHHGACLKIDAADHFDGEIDDDSLAGAFGNEYHGRVPARRWFITKLDLLAARAVGWELRPTSAFEALRITTVALPSAILGRPYSERLSGLGGIPFYNWTLASGSLPDGLQLDSFSGAILGTPTRTGSFAFTIRLQEYVEGSAGETRKMMLVVGR